MIVKALAALPAVERQDFVIVGNTEALERAARATDIDLSFGPSASADGNTIAVDEVALDAPLPEIGKVSPVAGDAFHRNNSAYQRHPRITARTVPSHHTLPLTLAALSHPRPPPLTPTLNLD